MENFNSAENYSAWNKKVLNRNEFWLLSKSSERYSYLASLAHLAANSHNTQPWCFKFQESTDSLQFYIDTSRVLPASDMVGRQATISVGCAMGNFEVAAAALGCSFEKTVLISDTKPISNEVPPILVAEYKISQSEAAYENNDIMKMYEAIFSRRVDRGAYDHDRKIDPSILHKIQLMGKDDQVKTILISDWGRKVALAELQLQADSFVINNNEFASEFINEWMIENESLSELGMPGATFRLNSVQTSKIKSRFKNKLGFESDDAAAIAQLGKKGILSCQCVGLLTLESDTPSGWLSAGIVLEKGALFFESHGIAWAVHAGLAEVSKVNMFMLRPIAMTSKRPAVLFRAGYLKASESRAPHSPRLAFEKVWRE